MQKVLALVLAFGVAALFSSAALAGADCTYHKTQAAVDKTDATKNVATAPATDKTDSGQVQTAQAEQPAKPAPVETKK
jgi:hypothetical protein